VDKYFYFLRTKVDIDVRNDKEENPETHAEDKVLKEIKDNCIAELEKAGFKNPPVFLVCKHPRLYDFSKLEDTAISDLPEMKKEVLLFAARSHSKDISRNRSKRLGVRTFLWALASGAIAAVPVPVVSFVVDASIIKFELEWYKKMYGLDDESLKQLTALGRAPQQVIEDVMKKHRVVGSATGGIKVAVALGSFGVGMIMEEGLKFVPAIGSAVNAVMSFTTTALFLNKIKAAMQEAAITLHTDMFSKASFGTSGEQQLALL